MRKIIVASKNPVKINATLNAFQKMFPGEDYEIEGISVPSGVDDQPFNDYDTFQGAWNRTENACKAFTNADYWVGIEGGIEEKGAEMEAYAWVIVKSAADQIGKGRTGTFFLPKHVAELVRSGKELGDADDIVFGKTNSKQENGAVGILTGDVIDRTKYYEEAVVLALIPFKNELLY